MTLADFSKGGVTFRFEELANSLVKVKSIRRPWTKTVQVPRRGIVRAIVRDQGQAFVQRRAPGPVYWSSLLGTLRIWARSKNTGMLKVSDREHRRVLGSGPDRVRLQDLDLVPILVPVLGRVPGRARVSWRGHGLVHDHGHGLVRVRRQELALDLGRVQDPEHAQAPSRLQTRGHDHGRN